MTHIKCFNVYLKTILYVNELNVVHRVHNLIQAFSNMKHNCILFLNYHLSCTNINVEHLVFWHVCCVWVFIHVHMSVCAYIWMHATLSNCVHACVSIHVTFKSIGVRLYACLFFLFIRASLWFRQIINNIIKWSLHCGYHFYYITNNSFGLFTLHYKLINSLLDLIQVFIATFSIKPKIHNLLL